MTKCHWQYSLNPFQISLIWSPKLTNSPSCLVCPYYLFFSVTGNSGAAVFIKQKALCQPSVAHTLPGPSQDLQHLWVPPEMTSGRPRCSADLPPGFPRALIGCLFCVSVLSLTPGISSCLQHSFPAPSRPKHPQKDSALASV